jgi:hypothetical protein
MGRRRRRDRRPAVATWATRTGWPRAGALERHPRRRCSTPAGCCSDGNAPTGRHQYRHQPDVFGRCRPAGRGLRRPDPPATCNGPAGGPDRHRLPAGETLPRRGRLAGWWRRWPGTRSDPGARRPEGSVKAAGVAVAPIRAGTPPRRRTPCRTSSLVIDDDPSILGYAGHRHPSAWRHEDVRDPLRTASRACA